MSTTAQILSQSTHKIPGKLQVTEYFFRVPLDHKQPSGPTLRLFARGVAKVEPTIGAKPTTAKSTPLPWLTYLQGGPGFGCRPPSAGGWVGVALDAGYRVLLLDQRGTGLSQPITPSTLQAISRKAPARNSLAEQAAYLRHFRAAGIVADAEAIRRALAESEGADTGRKWSIIGQSFGGFCVVHYLSRFPDGLLEAFTLGGLPPIEGHPDAVYRRLVKRWVTRSHEYYAKFPDDVRRVRALAKHLTNNEVVTPTGGRLSIHRLQGLGINAGSHGGFERMHSIFLRAAADLEYDGELSSVTMDEIEVSGAGFDGAILYALLHEPCYLQGEAANWSAERAIQATLGLRDADLNLESGEDPILFTSEAVRPSLFNDYPSLTPFKDLGEHLAKSSDWESLYDKERLAKNEVPVYSATYFDDQYVDFDLAQETAQKIKGCKVWITNSVYHDGIRTKADEVMQHLFAMKDDVID